MKKISVPACVRVLKKYVSIEFRCGMLITCRGLSGTPVFTENNKDGHELETMRYFQYRRRLPRPNIEETDKIGYFWDSAGPCRLKLCWVVAHGLYTAGKHRMMPMAGDKRDRAARFRAKMRSAGTVPNALKVDCHSHISVIFIVLAYRWYSIECIKGVRKNPGQKNVVSVKL